ncbi:MAG: hypothetical protein QM820_40195 [Minicystis sp.]
MTSEFVLKLCRQRRHPLSDLAGMCYALVSHHDYYAWDVLTTCYLGRPEIFSLRERETTIVTEGPSQGRTMIVPGGRKIRVMDAVNLEAFYAYLFQQWAR